MLKTDLAILYFFQFHCFHAVLTDPLSAASHARPPSVSGPLTLGGPAFQVDESVEPP